MEVRTMTANKLKQAALVLFTESGYEGTSLSEIAKAVGIKTPSIYAHFESKEQLFLALLDDVLREEREHFSKLTVRIAEQPPLERLQALYMFFTDLDNLTTGQAFLKRTMLVPPKHLQERLRVEFARQEAVFSDYLLTLLRECTGGGPSGSPSVGPHEERLLALFYALIDGLLVEHKLYERALYRERQAIVWDWLRESVSSASASERG
jgi:AcrR family transcriptional regulator